MLTPKQLLLTLVLSFLACSPLHAGFILVTNPAEIGGENFSDLASLGPLNSILPPPVPISTSSGNTINLVSVSRRDGNPSVEGGFLFHLLNGSSGPPVLTAGVVGDFFSRTEVVFDFARPVRGFGAEIFASARILNARIDVEALDADGNQLAHFNLATGPGFTSPVGFQGFAGILSDTDNISQIRFTAQGQEDGFRTARTQISVQTLQIASEPTATPVPEPSTLVLLGVGVLALPLFRKRLRS